MESISENELKRIEELTEVLRNKRQRIWMDEYKPFGYEILDIRLRVLQLERSRQPID